MMCLLVYGSLVSPSNNLFIKSYFFTVAPYLWPMVFVLSTSQSLHHMMLCFSSKTDKSLLESVAKIAEMLFARIKEFIMIPNYKLKFSERKQLEGAIMDELDYCGIEKLKNKSGKLTAELISLGEKRESEVRNS